MVSEKAVTYLNRKVIQYILNRAFPENRRFKNFYYDNEFYLNTLQNTKNLSREQIYAQAIYDKTKLSLKEERSLKDSASFKGKLQDFFINLNTKRFVFNTLKPELVNEYTKNFGFLFSSIPLIIGAVVLSTAIMYWPLILATTALVLISKALYNSYNIVQTHKKSYIEEVKANFSLEKELIEEQKQCKEFEDKIGITALVNYLTKKEVIFTLKDSLSGNQNRQLNNLLKVMDKTPGISTISKQIISEITNLNDNQYNSKWKEKLKKISPPLSETIDPSEARIDLYKAISKVNSNLKIMEKSTSPTPSFNQIEVQEADLLSTPAPSIRQAGSKEQKNIERKQR